jgi:hypothetical protein
MKRILSTSFLGLLGMLAHSLATTVTFSSVPTSRTVVDASSSTLAAGDLIWVGTFASESFSFNSSLSLSANISAIESAGGWSQFTTSTASISSSPAGKLGGTVSDTSSAADSFNGKLIYAWVFNSNSVGTATQMGIFRAGTGATQPWVFPTNGSVPDTVTLSTTSSSTPTMVAVGGAGSVLSSGAGNMQLSAASVPEPSTIATLLGGAGLMGLVARRRRAVK